MKLIPITDPAFSNYGRIVEGFSTRELTALLAAMPVPDQGVEYLAQEPGLQQAPQAQALCARLYGGMPVQLGVCRGRNTRLNCLEYHRSSEFNLGAEDFVLLLARQQEIQNGCLDTGLVQAFYVPAGVLVEVYATSLHYAPCQAPGCHSFRVMVALPQGTNLSLEKPEMRTPEDALLWAANKWLLAHEEADEAAQGAYVGLKGKNLDIAE